MVYSRVRIMRQDVMRALHSLTWLISTCETTADAALAYGGGLAEASS